MSYEMIITLIACVGILLAGVLVPWLKKKGWWVATLFAVNIAEQIFNYSKAGPEKYI
jgi:hypothetical protein